jgi:hypothetical protein
LIGHCGEFFELILADYEVSGVAQRIKTDRAAQWPYSLFY